MRGYFSVTFHQARDALCVVRDDVRGKRFHGTLETRVTNSQRAYQAGGEVDLPAESAQAEVPIVNLKVLNDASFDVSKIQKRFVEHRKKVASKKSCSHTARLPFLFGPFSSHLLTPMSTRESALFRLARGRAVPETPEPGSPAPATPKPVVEKPVESQKSEKTTTKSTPTLPSPPLPPTPVSVLSWAQDTACVFVRVGVPKGTSVSRITVNATVHGLEVAVAPELSKAKWYGVEGGKITETVKNVTLHGAPTDDSTASTDATKIAGALTHAIVAGDTMWTLERGSPQDTQDEVNIVLTKSAKWLSSPAWRALFVGDEEKGLLQVAKELHDADEPSPLHSDLPEAAQIAVEETRERRLAMGAGQWHPDNTSEVDDFRVVLSNDDE